MSVGNIYAPPKHKDTVWDVNRVPLYNDPEPWLSGRVHNRVRVPFNALYINDVQRRCRLFVGSGQRYFIGELNPGQRRAVELPASVDEYTVEWDGFQNQTVAPFETTINPILDLWTANNVIFYSESFDVGPRLSAFFRPESPSINGSDFTIIGVPTSSPIVLAVNMLTSTHDQLGGYTTQGNALGDNAAPSMMAAINPYTVWDTDLFSVSPAGGPASTVRGMSRAFTNTYGVSFQTNTRPYIPTNAIAANSRESLFTFWKDSTSLRNFRLRYLTFAIYEMSAATDLTIELKRIDSQPTGGTSRTPEPHNSGASSAETVCRTNPSGGANEVGNPFVSRFFNFAAAFTTTFMTDIDLYDDAFPDAVEPPILVDGIGQGFAVVADVTTAVTISATAHAIFTEH